MGIGKEYIHPLEELARRQERIYPDACDYGIWDTPAIRKTIKECLNGLKQLEGGEARTWTNGSSYTTRLGYEMDGDTVSG
jgi:hypothetical protein